jgi:AraC-like DNA-binding protein
MGGTWLCLCARRDLSIQLIWGHPTHEDLDALVASVRAQAGQAPQLALFDCTQLDDATREDPEPYQRVLEACSAPRRALVCAGSMTSLFTESAVEGCESQLFRDFEAALDWLAPTLTPEQRAGVRRLRAGATASHNLLTRLRQLFMRQDVAKVDVAFAARQLGSSRRSLQRALTRQGTSFRTELGQARLERAKRELTTGASVTGLAYELGFQNVQSFIRVFKQGTGITPGAWRRNDSALRRAVA